MRGVVPHRPFRVRRAPQDIHAVDGHTRRAGCSAIAHRRGSMHGRMPFSQEPQGVRPSPRSAARPSLAEHAEQQEEACRGGAVGDEHRQRPAPTAAPKSRGRNCGGQAPKVAGRRTSPSTASTLVMVMRAKRPAPLLDARAYSPVATRMATAEMPGRTANPAATPPRKANHGGTCGEDSTASPPQRSASRSTPALRSRKTATAAAA